MRVRLILKRYMQRRQRFCLRTVIQVFLVLLPVQPAFADFSTNLIPVADTALFENSPTNNLGGMTFAPAGTTLVGTHCRALFKFDVADALPSNATVTSAALNLTVVQVNSPASYGLHRLLVDWGEGDGVGGPNSSGSLGSLADEGEADWFARFFSTNGSVLWSAPGAAAGSDYVETPSVVVPMVFGGNNFSSPSMAADLQVWLNNPGTNFGWILVETNETLLGAAERVATREDPVNTPVLTIQYILTAAQPVLSNITLAAGQLDFQFIAQSNRTYAAEYRTSLTSGSWTVLTNIPAQPADGPVTVSDVFNPTNRCYRVRTP